MTICVLSLELSKGFWYLISLEHLLNENVGDGVVWETLWRIELNPPE